MKNIMTPHTIKQKQRTVRSACLLLGVTWGYLCSLPCASAESVANVSDAADIKGITLGMTPDQVKAVFPEIHFLDFQTELYGGVGIGHGATTLDWSLEIELAKAPSGMRVSYINYFKKYIEADRATLQETFRKELSAKYGEPAYVGTNKEGYYIAYWGDKGKMKDYLSLISHTKEDSIQYEIESVTKDLEINDGHYIIAVCGPTIDWARGSKEGVFLRVIMIDLTPYHAQIKEKQRQEQERINRNSQQGTGL